MKRANISNRRIEKIFRIKQNQDLSIRLKTIKPQVNVQCPESFIFYKTLFHSDKIQPTTCKNKFNNFILYFIYKFRHKIR